MRIRLHVLGAASCALAALASALLVSTFRLAWPDTPQRDSTVAPYQLLRVYSHAGRIWLACAGPQADVGASSFQGGARGTEYRCSDGENLSAVRYECVAADVAERELQARVWGIGGSAPRWRARTTAPYASGQVVDFVHPQRAGFGDEGPLYSWAFAFVDGKDVVVLYGPTRDHVVGLYESKPSKQWYRRHRGAELAVAPEPAHLRQSSSAGAVARAR